MGLLVLRLFTLLPVLGLATLKLIPVKALDQLLDPGYVEVFSTYLSLYAFLFVFVICVLGIRTRYRRWEMKKCRNRSLWEMKQWRNENILK